MARRSAERDIQELLEFRCVRRLRTVHGLLQEANGLGLLADPLMEKATAEIVSGSRPRYDIQRDIKQKERARDMLVKKYKTSSLPEVGSLGRASCILAALTMRETCTRCLAWPQLALLATESLHYMSCLLLMALSNALAVQEDILRCLYSLSDNNSYLLFNRDPVDRMIEYLHAYFRPGYAESGASLAISGGLAGARLTHNHERQFHYVLQSLTLWREISHDVSSSSCFGHTLCDPQRWHLGTVCFPLDRMIAAHLLKHSTL